MTKRFSTIIKRSILPMLLVFVMLLSVTTTPLAAKEGQINSIVKVYGHVSINGILKELCKRITDKDKTEDVRKAIVAANDARPPRYVDEGGNIDPPPGGRFVLTQIGDSSLGIADFGQRGFLRIESIVTGVNPLTIESNVEGTLKDFPEVVLPIRKVEIDFTWLANGRAYGSATYLANTAEGERVNIPVTYSIEYRAEKPSIELPARFAGEMALESYNMETRETSGPINYYQVEYPAKLR